MVAPTRPCILARNELCTAEDTAGLVDVVEAVLAAKERLLASSGFGAMVLLPFGPVLVELDANNDADGTAILFELLSPILPLNDLAAIVLRSDIIYNSCVDTLLCIS